jgi:hypothetical protein
VVEITPIKKNLNYLYGATNKNKSKSKNSAKKIKRQRKIGDKIKTYWPLESVGYAEVTPSSTFE